MEKLVLKELGDDLDFRVEAISKNKYLHDFKKILFELSRSYNEFPLFMIEIMAEQYRIPKTELNYFIRKFMKQGRLKRLYNYSFKITLLD